LGRTKEKQEKGKRGGKKKKLERDREGREREKASEKLLLLLLLRRRQRVLHVRLVPVGLLELLAQPEQRARRGLVAADLQGIDRREEPAARGL